MYLSMLIKLYTLNMNFLYINHISINVLKNAMDEVSYNIETHSLAAVAGDNIQGGQAVMLASGSSGG